MPTDDRFQNLSTEAKVLLAYMYLDNPTPDEMRRHLLKQKYIDSKRLQKHDIDALTKMGMSPSDIADVQGEIEEYLRTKV